MLLLAGKERACEPSLWPGWDVRVHPCTVWARILVPPAPEALLQPHRETWTPSPESGGIWAGTEDSQHQGQGRDLDSLNPETVGARSIRE